MSKHDYYGQHPKGCRFSTNTTNKMVPVALEDVAEQGTRAQRRWAQRELRKLGKNTARRLSHDHE